MNYNDLARELKKHTDVVEITFERNNLQLLNYSYKPYDEDDADCELLIEISTVEGVEISNSVYVKVNLYDDNNDIYLTESTYIDANLFAGYDTIGISLYDDERTLLNAKSGRIYVTR